MLTTFEPNNESKFKLKVEGENLSLDTVKEYAISTISVCIKNWFLF
jgi:hypothetical protein